MPYYVPTLTKLIADLYSPYSAAIHIRTEIDPVRLGIDRALPCALILNELVSNAFRHAFPGGKKGSVFICLKRLSQIRRLRLEVSDTGCGLPEFFDPAEGRTLGMQIVNILVRQIGGEFVWERGSQTTFAITFPAEDK